jgi:hypothetical protein
MDVFYILKLGSSCTVVYPVNVLGEAVKYEVRTAKHTLSTCDFLIFFIAREYSVKSELTKNLPHGLEGVYK